MTQIHFQQQRGTVTAWFHFILLILILFVGHISDLLIMVYYSYLITLNKYYNNNQVIKFHQIVFIILYLKTISSTCRVVQRLEIS